mmetsp:Transcript_8500/g.13025  ORF Transcript_8500/g.13025 Transcript_8500/m.13025 type:complete len:543 (+) Transcript_8500:66-1694(+)
MHCSSPSMIRRRLLVTGYWLITTEVWFVGVLGKGEPLRKIREIRSSALDGKLAVSLEVNVAKFCLPETCYWTRAYNGSIPGPTFRLRPGDMLELTIINNLSEKDNELVKFDKNNFGHINSTNIHVHGLRVSPLQDDIEPIIYPGTRHTYRYNIPKWNGGASAWYHPHGLYDGHGSATIQWAGGMFGAIIVDEQNFTSDPKYQKMNDIVLHLQNVAFDDSPMNLKNLQYNDDDDHQVIDAFKWRFNKDLLQPEPLWKGSYLLVNGQIEPNIKLDANRWSRLRIFAASTFYTVHTRLDGDCQWFLLTKDGIPIVSAPRRFGILPLWPGARVDVLIHCTGPGAWILDSSVDDYLDPQVLGGYFTRDYSYYIKRGTTVLATFDQVSKSVPHLPKFSFAPMPNLASVAVPDQRATLVFMRHNKINHRSFDSKSNPSFLRVQAGNIIEYDIKGLTEHPVHFHIHPLQLFSVDKNDTWTFPTFAQNSNAGFMQIGDWHDTIQLYVRTATFRQQPVYPGIMHFHCHIVQHAEFGMMGHIDVLPPFYQQHK